MTSPHPVARRTVEPSFLERRRRTGIVLSLLVLVACGALVGAATGVVMAEVCRIVLSHVLSEL
ncbi:hypothetical protein [Nocardioides houyundeii]|uniref:hypothetical protein n=1 Tax=Nocardioides houyundeii TaxID=2045452 RepID=UPI000C79305A|nr:hypothetical protein [Nocardioides houyundeii]